MSLTSKQTGNKETTASFVDVVEALKRNIARSINVAELVKVTEVKQNAYRCVLLTNTSQTIECISLQNLSFQVDDIALVVFTSTDFRTNLLKAKNNQELTTLSVDKQPLHSKMYGVLTGLVYRK